MFEFRMANGGRVYVTGFTDDRSRFGVRSGAYQHKSAKESVDALQGAPRKGRIPRGVYLDNGKQFIAKEFKAENIPESMFGSHPQMKPFEQEDEAGSHEL